jgi:hypothetical protein
MINMTPVEKGRLASVMLLRRSAWLSTRVAETHLLPCCNGATDSEECVAPPANLRSSSLGSLPIFSKLSQSVRA